MAIIYYNDQDVKGSITTESNITAGSLTKASDTVINSWAGDSNKAGFEARGTSQGTGYFYAGQSATYGGGFFYNGDGSPAFPATGESSDTIAFYRKDGGTNEVVFYYGYGSNHVYFRGGIDIGVTANATTDTDKFLVSDSGEVKYRTGAEVLSDIGGAPATGGAYLPLTGGTMSGAINMGDNDIDGIDELKFSSGTKLGDDGSTSYVKLTYADSNDGGLKVSDINGQVQGYLYGAGGVTSQFGILDGSGSWAVRCVEDSYVELRHDNVVKFATTSTGIEVSGRGYFNATDANTPSADDVSVSGYGLLGNRTTNPIYIHNFGDGGVRLATNVALGSSGGMLVTDSLVTVDSGNILLSGTGRIQGIDTVSASTDAANKAYVDAHGGGVGPFLPLAGGTMTGNINLGNGDRIRWTDNPSGGLDLTCQAGVSAIQHTGTGYFQISNDCTGGIQTEMLLTNFARNQFIRFQADNGNPEGTTSCEVRDYFFLDGASATYASGASTAVYTVFPDLSYIALGTGKDLQLHHDGTNSYIEDTGTGDLYIRSADSMRLQGINQSNFLIANQGGNVNLYYNNANKFDTTSYGVNVTGQVTASADKATPEYSFKGDQDTGVNQPGGVADQVGFMNAGKDTLTMLATGQMKLDIYTATATSSSGGSLNPNQSFQAVSKDTLAILAVDPFSSCI